MAGRPLACIIFKKMGENNKNVGLEMIIQDATLHREITTI